MTEATLRKALNPLTVAMSKKNDLALLLSALGTFCGPPAGVSTLDQLLEKLLLPRWGRGSGNGSDGVLLRLRRVFTFLLESPSLLEPKPKESQTRFADEQLCWVGKLNGWPCASAWQMGGRPAACGAWSVEQCWSLSGKCTHCSGQEQRSALLASWRPGHCSRAASPAWVLAEQAQERMSPWALYTSGRKEYRGPTD